MTATFADRDPGDEDDGARKRREAAIAAKLREDLAAVWLPTTTGQRVEYVPRPQHTIGFIVRQL